MNKKLSKTALKRYKQWLALKYPICQICNQKQAQDAHHLRFGCYGADKDDTSLIAVDRECHEWCHQNKHESQEKYEHIAKENWEKYANAHRS